MSSFVPNPNFERELKRMVQQNLGPALRPAVRSVTCPDHPDHEPPDVAQSPDGTWHIVACCERGAELAAKAAGVGDVTWTTAEDLPSS